MIRSGELRAMELPRLSGIGGFLRGPGFQADEVDEVLRRSADTLHAYEMGLSHSNMSVTSDELVTQEFRYVRGSQAYDADAIDDLLERITEQLREYEASS